MTDPFRRRPPNRRATRRGSGPLTSRRRWGHPSPQTRETLPDVCTNVGETRAPRQCLRAAALPRLCWGCSLAAVAASKIGTAGFGPHHACRSIGCCQHRRRDCEEGSPPSVRPATNDCHDNPLARDSENRRQYRRAIRPDQASPFFRTRLNLGGDFQGNFLLAQLAHRSSETDEGHHPDFEPDH